MRRPLCLVIALSMMGAPAALAQNPHSERYPPVQPSPQGYGGPQGRYPDKHGHGAPGHGGPPPHQSMHQARRWQRGERFDGHRYVLDWRHHHLRQPPQGYEWVNVDGEYLMIAIATGVIAEILANQP